MRLNQKDRNRFYRCQTCGRLVGSRRLDLCAGHHLKNAYYTSLVDWIMIKIGVLK